MLKHSSTHCIHSPLSEKILIPKLQPSASLDIMANDA